MYLCLVVIVKLFYFLYFCTVIMVNKDEFIACCTCCSKDIDVCMNKVRKLLNFFILCTQ